MNSAERPKKHDPYQGLPPLQLKAAFWELCHKLPPPVTSKDIKDAAAELTTKQPAVEEPSNERTLHNRAVSELRKAYCNRLLLLLSHAPITSTYASLIVDRRYGNSYHWGVNPDQFQDPNAFPAYLIGLEKDSDELGILDPAKSKEIERANYKSELADHLFEHEQIIRMFGQDAIDKLQQRIREGTHIEHPKAVMLRAWQRDFLQKYKQEI